MCKKICKIALICIVRTVDICMGTERAIAVVFYQKVDKNIPFILIVALPATRTPSVIIIIALYSADTLSTGRELCSAVNANFCFYVGRILFSKICTVTPGIVLPSSTQTQIAIV